MYMSYEPPAPEDVKRIRLGILWKSDGLADVSRDTLKVWVRTLDSYMVEDPVQEEALKPYRKELISELRRRLDQ